MRFCIASQLFAKLIWKILARTLTAVPSAHFTFLVHASIYSLSKCTHVSLKVVNLAVRTGTSHYKQMTVVQMSAVPCLNTVASLK